MRKITAFSLLIILNISCTSQKMSVTDVDPTKYMNTITADELKTHLYIVAADSMEGRETGSAGQKKAGVYLINQYKKNRQILDLGKVPRMHRLQWKRCFGFILVKLLCTGTF